MAPTPETNSGRRALGAHDMYAALLRGELSGTDALAASQQMLQILMDSMANAVFWKDLDSCYLGCNKVFARFAGVDPELLIGQSDRDMPWADSEEFDSDWFIDWDRAVIDSGEPRYGIIEQLRGSDGEDHWLRTNKVPLRDLDGQIIGILGTFDDVTDQRHAEDELQKTLDELDERVQQRTMDLMRVNESLRREVEDRVRLQAQERQQRAYAEALRDTAAAMATTFDLGEVQDHVLVGVQRLVSHDLTAILLVDADGELELSKRHVVFGYEIPESAEPPDLHSLSIVRRLAAAPGPAIIDQPDSALGPAASVLGSRMRVGDQLVGYLLVESSTTGFYSERHGDRLRAIADQAGPPILNSQLATRVSELAAAEERQRLARELHDAVNQTLWTAALTAESMLQDLDTESELHQRVERLRLLTRGALAEMRSLLLELRPSELAQVGLAEIIEQLITGLECRRALDVTIDLDDVDLEPDTHLAFYRIAQEALGNIAQHSQATALTVELSAGPPVRMVISDDGAGFDPDETPAGHLGLTIMRERADGVGAELEVATAAGEGTTIRLTAAGS
jgi:PAS domain S-box-containing protein